MGGCRRNCELTVYHIHIKRFAGFVETRLFYVYFYSSSINTIMSLFDKVLDAVEAVKWKVEDLAFTVKDKALTLAEYVKYDVLKKDLPNFDYLNEVEAAPKKKKKKTTKKKKK